MSIQSILFLFTFYPISQLPWNWDLYYCLPLISLRRQVGQGLIQAWYNVPETGTKSRWCHCNFLKNHKLSICCFVYRHNPLRSGGKRLWGEKLQQQSWDAVEIKYSIRTSILRYNFGTKVNSWQTPHRLEDTQGTITDAGQYQFKSQ